MDLIKKNIEKPLVYIKPREVLIAKNTLSVWVNGHFYYWLEGEKITDQAAIAEIKKSKHLLYQTRPA